MNTEINPKLLDVVEYRVGDDLFAGTVVDTLGSGMVLIEGSDESGVARHLDAVGADEIITLKVRRQPEQDLSGYPDAQQAFEQGIFLLQNALVDEARGYFSRAFALDSRLAGVLLNSANQLSERGALDAAMAVYALIMELQPHYESARENLAVTRLNRGVASARIGALDKAILDFDLAMRLRPSPETVNLAKKNIAAAYTKLGIDHVAIKRFEEARHFFAVAFRLDPADEVAAKNLGFAVVCSAAWNRPRIELPSEETFRESLGLGLTYSECLNAYGATLALLGDASVARRVLQRAMEIDPANELPQRNLAILSLREGIPDPRQLELGLRAMQADPAHLATI
jgi:tetratricopeptide (TPR) repeat protein